MKIILCQLIFISFLFGKNITIKVEKMHCPLCTISVKKAIKNLDGINKVSVKLNTKLVKVDFQENIVSIADILEAIKTTSYEGKVIKD